MAITFKTTPFAFYQAIVSHYAYGDSQWFAASVNRYFISTDRCITWTEITNCPIKTTYAMEYGNGRLVIIGLNSSSSVIAAATTNGGATWSTNALANSFSNIKWCGNQFIATDGHGARYGKSTDGLNWTFVNFSEQIYGNNISYVNGKVVILSTNSGVGFLSSDNGNTFSKITPPEPISGLSYGNGAYFGFMYSTGTIQYGYRTTDFATWTRVTMPSPEAYRRHCFVSGQFFAPVSTSKAYISTDAITWSTQSLPYSTSYGLLMGGGVLALFPTEVNTLLYYIYNTAPTAPTSINVPSSIKGGSTATITWGASSDSDGNLAGYQLERRVESGTWQQIYRGSLRSYTDTITFGWTSVAYRVKAYDTENAESGYATSSAVTVTNNTAPTISGSDGNIGAFSAAFTAQTYIVADAQNDAVTVTESVDGVQKRSYTATLGISNTFSFTDAEWQQILNGSHTITITATDSAGLKASRQWTFTKAMNTFTFTLNPPLVADAMPERCVVNAIGHFPAGSMLTIKVCNNANDASPTWEDVSSKLGEKHFFTNATKTATSWGFGLQCTLSRGSATGAVWLDYININYR